MLQLLAAALIAGNHLLVVNDDGGKELHPAYPNDVAAWAAPMPNVQTLADQGIRFDRFYTASVCSPTRAQFLTGTMGDISTITSVIFGWDPVWLPLGTPTLPNAMPICYTTALIGKWHLGMVGDGTGCLREPFWVGGFDFSVAYDGPEPYWGYNGLYQSVGPTCIPATVDPLEYLTTRQINDAIQAVQVLPEPWLIVVMLKAPHKPFHSPPPSLHTQPNPITNRQRLAATMEALDTELGRLLTVTDLSDTTVWYWGDNGTTKAVGGGKGTLRENGICVPLIVAGAGVSWTGTNSQLVRVTDFMATLVDLAGGSGPIPEDSQSFAPLLTDPAWQGRCTIYQEQMSPNMGMGPATVHDATAVSARYKLRVDLLTGQESFYDLLTDPTEASPLLPPYTPEQVQWYSTLGGVLTSQGR